MLRDLGGLIIIDFIDMNIQKHKKIVENRLYDLFGKDRARIQMGKISKFGLLEISRQRLKKGISEFSEIICFRCKGKGRIHNINSISLIILNILYKLSLKNNIIKIHIELPIEIMFYILNNKRHIIYNIEKKQSINIILFPNKLLTFPEYKFIKIKKPNYEKLVFICNVNNNDLLQKNKIFNYNFNEDFYNFYNK
jgi:ribonuclease E